MKGLKLFLSSEQNLLAIVIIGFYVFISIGAPWLAPQEDPSDPSPFRKPPELRIVATSIPRPPSWTLPLGTSPNGYDIYYSLVWGTRYALRLGLIVTLTTATFGVLLGALSGYLGGSTNRLVLRVTDAFLAFPAIAGVFLFHQILLPMMPGTPPTILQEILDVLKLDAVMLALILFSWMPYARIINASVVVLKRTEYVLAAQVVGANPFRITFRHLLPNGIAPAIVLVARDVGAMVILEAAFTFIGVGSNTPWSVLLVTGRNWIIGPGGNPLIYWWVFIPVTLMLVFFGIGWNLLGDGLNAALNPMTADD